MKAIIMSLCTCTQKAIRLLRLVKHSKQSDHSLFTQVGDDPPVRVGHSEPLAVTRADVDVDGAKVVVLLVT